MKYTNFVVLSLVLLSLSACQKQTGHSHGHGGHSHDHGSHGHDDHAHDEPEVCSYTLWSEKSELFVEFPPLVVGQLSSFATHLTALKSHKAIDQGTVTVSLIKGGKGIRQKVEQPKSPGLFKLGLKPSEAGYYSLVFDIESTQLKDRFQIDSIQVFENANEAKVPSKTEVADEISFGKEQAWKMEFATEAIRKGEIYDNIETGGEIVPAQQDEQLVVAPATGILLSKSDNYTVGAKVTAGEKLFTIIGGNIADHNIETEYLKARSAFERAKAQYERQQKLFKTKAITESALEEARLNFQLAESEYRNLSVDYGKGGKSVRSPLSGYIKKRLKENGEYVNSGEAIAEVAQNRKMVIEADVNPSDFWKLNDQMTAHFQYGDKVYSIEDFKGHLLSYGKYLSPEHPQIPVYFEVQSQGKLLPGSYVQVWIKTQKRSQALKVPVSALLEDHGVYHVIVQLGGESFVKREIQLGVSDGMHAEVLSGLKEGERVVTMGAYQVKMASLSGQAIGHGHVH